MPKKEMRDLVVLLPGILGSVLQKDGQDLWAPSSQAIWNVLFSLGSSLQQLKLQGDDPSQDYLDDGIRATRLVNDVHMIPGLWKIDGYSKISRMLTDTFKVEQGNINDNKLANYFEFPYDWRRDNQLHARHLKQLIDQRLAQWRKETPYKDAKVILIGHSMGGLIARYYLEVLEGWHDCKALITFGTPYRGSVNALNVLTNGYKLAFINLSEVLHSFTSVYQLLPIYPLVEVNGIYQRVAETQNIPNVEWKRAEKALAFHRKIEDAVTHHQNDAEYRRSYKILPIVGTKQPTYQSASLVAGKLVVSQQLPSGIHPNLGDGDGTVPRISATPIDLSDEYRETFLPECHASLQNSARVLDDLQARLIQMQSSTAAIRGTLSTPENENEAAISLYIDDLYLASETTQFQARLVDISDQTIFGALHARIQRISDSVAIQRSFIQMETGWALTVDDLPPGVYRVEVSTQKASPGAPSPVHDIFEIVAA